MRVLHVINDLNTGGAEKLVLDTLPLLARRGVPADLLLLDGTPHPFLAELRRLDVCRIRDTGGRPRDPRTPWRLRRFLADYDVIHAHLFPTTYWVAAARALGPERPALVLTEHNVTNRRRGRPLLSSVDRMVYRNYDLILCVSDPVRDALALHARLPRRKLVVIPNGVDLSRIEAAVPADRRVAFGDPTGRSRVILQVSSFRDQKDQATLVRALPLLPADVRLALAGEGPNRTACMRLASDLGVRDRVDFLGVREDVASLLRAADIVALSSRHEGLSLASIEGLGSGRPFVASDAPGLRQIVDGAGILFPVGDARAFAVAARRLLDDPELARSVALRGRERALRYDLRTMVDRLVAAYESVAPNTALVTARAPGTPPSS